MDKHLLFDDIQQKDKGRSGENFQNRGMAALDDRVQQIMHDRLHKYGFIDRSLHLPSSVPSGVNNGSRAINN
jgi:hypothetical protein